MGRLFWLHLKKQWFFRLLPLLLLYGLLLPAQNQFLNRDPLTILEIQEVYEEARMYLLLFGIWNVYLAFQIFLYRDLKEITASLLPKGRWLWCILFLASYLLSLGPYLFWLYQKTAAEGCGLGACILPLQILNMSLLVYFLIQPFHSGEGGLAGGTVYYLLDIFGKGLPGALSIARPGVPGGFFEKEWFFCQSLWAAGFLTGAILLEKNRRSW